MKNFDAEARDSVAPGTALVSLYVDAWVAANQVLQQYAKLLTTLAGQPYPLPVAAARTGAAAAIAEPDTAAAGPGREVAAAMPQRDAAAVIAVREAAVSDVREDRKSSRPAAPTTVASRKVAHKKTPASAVKRRAGVAKRRVRAAR